MSLDGYFQIMFTTIIPTLIAIVIEVKFGNQKVKKKQITATIVIWFFIFIIVTIIYFLTKPNNYEAIETKSNIVEETIETGDQSSVIIDKSYKKTIYNNYYTDTLLESTPSPESTASQEDETLEGEEITQFNFGQEMQTIYNNEDEIQKEIINKKDGKPIYSSIYPGVSYWRISNKVRLIVVASNFRDHECSRTYYFDENEKITFALIKDDIGEHRLYFYNNILIRYIDENGRNYDINVNLDDHECKWTKLALEESYEIFSGVKKPSESDDFSVTASYNMNTPQTANDGVNVLVEAETSFPADRVTISGISDYSELEPTDMHGGLYKWQFVATFYIKGTYTVTVTAYYSEGESVSDEFIYIY